MIVLPSLQQQNQCYFVSHIINMECALPVPPTRLRDRYRLPVAYKQATSHLTAKDFSNLTCLKLREELVKRGAKSTGRKRELL